MCSMILFYKFRITLAKWKFQTYLYAYYVKFKPFNSCTFYTNYIWTKFKKHGRFMLTIPTPFVWNVSMINKTTCSHTSNCKCFQAVFLSILVEHGNLCRNAACPHVLTESVLCIWKQTRIVLLQLFSEFSPWQNRHGYFGYIRNSPYDRIVLLRLFSEFSPWQNRVTSPVFGIRPMTESCYFDCLRNSPYDRIVLVRLSLC